MTLPASASTVPASAPRIGGTQLWEARYPGFNQKEDTPHSVAVSPDGSRVFVTGSSDRNGTHLDIATVASVATTGERMWVNRYAGAAGGGDAGQAVAFDPTSTTVFAAGYSRETAGDADFTTFALDRMSSATPWLARYTRGYALGQDLAVSPNGSTIFVTGQLKLSGAPFHDFDYGTVAYATSAAARN